MKKHGFPARLARHAWAGSLIAFSPWSGATLSLSDDPLFLTVQVPPNLIVTLDDSGSMSRAFTPDLCGNPNAICDNNPDARLDPRYVKASHYNPLYYNPNIKYELPVDGNGNPFSTSFSAAYHNGFDTAFGSADLATGYRPSAGLYISSSSNKDHEFMRHYSSDVRCRSSTDRCQYSAGGSWVNMPSSTSCSSNSACQSRTMPAYYYVYEENNAGCNKTKTDDDCYTLKIVTASSGPGSQDLNGDGAVNAADKDERLNFAIWYSFYRTRNLMTISAASRAFVDVAPTTRVGWQALHTCRGSATSFKTSDCEGWQSTSSNFSNALAPFSGAHKQNFYTWLVRLPMGVGSGTPLAQSLERVGSYLTVNANTAAGVAGTPYEHFTESYPEEFKPVSCRKNFHLLMTDGVWTATTSPGNVDAASASLPQGTADVSSYSARSPYTDTQSNTLGDLAFKYWITDLSSGASGLANTILPVYKDRSGGAVTQYWNPKNNPATWQHLVNFTVGLGLTPFLANAGLTYEGDTYSGSYGSLYDGSTSWPNVSSSTQSVQDGARVADLWHAAINSRGQFFSADDPEALNTAFMAVIRGVSAATPSAAALAANSTQLQSGTLVFQAKFDSKDWSGRLLAIPVQGNGSVGTEYWDAATRIPAHTSRKVFTLNGAVKQAVSCTGDLLAALDADNRCADRLNWLKGDTSLEARFYNATSNPNATFRSRPASVLGDIVNSDPAFVQKADYGYGSSSNAGFTESSSYLGFLNANTTRTPVVYVGANDGMLHAFQADTGNPGSGKELFAYIPKGVYGTLEQLSSSAYSHQYLVDGAPSVGDAFLSGAWSTVLVGGLNAGGKTVYALDVTDPDDFSEGDILWEYADSADLGYTYSQPQIARLNSGDWAAIFGNGYNSASGKAFLYVVKLSDGTLLKKIPAGIATANGLSTPVLWDSDGDKIIDHVYAGDLQGSLWKFDLSAPSAGDWALGNGGFPLFSASNASGQVQPITSQPRVGAHPSGGVLVFFGTGQYLSDADVADTQIQSYYGIWDKGWSATVAKADLQRQTIVNETTKNAYWVRETSNNSVDYAATPVKRGWYLDLVYPDTSTTGGERVVSASLLREQRVIFTTLIPSRDPCSPGGDSWLMELEMMDGSRPETSVFDLDNDGQFTSADYIAGAGGVPASGVKSTVGIMKTPVWLEKPDSDKALKLMSGTGGGIMGVWNKKQHSVLGGTMKRIYWKQIQ